MVIAISRAVADLLIADGLPSERIAVIPNSVEPVSDPIHAPASEDVLLLARHAPNKNVALALEGFARLLELEPRWMGRLRIVGGAGPHSRALRALADRLGVSARVDWIAHLSPQALEHCWRSSFCLLSTSRMEGFDYPCSRPKREGFPHSPAGSRCMRSCMERALSCLTLMMGALVSPLFGSGLRAIPAFGFSSPRPV